MIHFHAGMVVLAWHRASFSPPLYEQELLSKMCSPWNRVVFVYTGGECSRVAVCESVCVYLCGCGIGNAAGRR